MAISQALSERGLSGAATRHIEQAYGGRIGCALLARRLWRSANPLYLRPGTNLMASRTSVPITGNVMVREKVEGPLRDSTVPATPGDPKVRDRLLKWIEAQGMLLGEEAIRVMTETTSLESRPNIRGAPEDDLLRRTHPHRRSARGRSRGVCRRRGSAVEAWRARDRNDCARIGQCRAVTRRSHGGSSSDRHSATP